MADFLLCKDCKWPTMEPGYVKRVSPNTTEMMLPHVTETSLCKHKSAIMDTSLVTGLPIYHTCGWMRSPDEPCGESGKLFVKREG